MSRSFAICSDRSHWGGSSIEDVHCSWSRCCHQERPAHVRSISAFMPRPITITGHLSACIGVLAGASITSNRPAHHSCHLLASSQTLPLWFPAPFDSTSRYIEQSMFIPTMAGSSPSACQRVSGNQTTMSVSSSSAICCSYHQVPYLSGSCISNSSSSVLDIYTACLLSRRLR